MDGIPVKVLYKNWSGEIRERDLVPLKLWFGSTKWHPEPQYLLKCFDDEDGETKDFALLGFMGPITGEVT